MQLRALDLVDFRNFDTERVEFGPAFTVLHGRNGAGKTNVLEALYFISTLRSFRGADLKSMVRRERPGAQVALQAYDDALGVPTTLSVRIDRGPRATRRSARVDQKLIRAASEFYGRLSAVLFTPEDLNILRGSPKGRRQFLDRVLFARQRGHIADIADYEKLLRSRNRLLKDAAGRAPDPQLMASYEAGLIEKGARIIDRRVRLVRDIAPGFSQAFAEIHDLEASDQGPGARLACELEYRSSVGPFAGPSHARGESADLDKPWESALAAALEAQRGRDIARGTTSVGPHRDELEVRLDGEAAVHFASQGQTRALVLAFKIAELRQSRALRGRAPLLLLDDVTSELDPRRNAQLFEALAREVGQCVLTTTAPDFIHLPTAVDRVDLHVDRGQIRANLSS